MVQYLVENASTGLPDWQPLHKWLKNAHNSSLMVHSPVLILSDTTLLSHCDNISFMTINLMHPLSVQLWTQQTFPFSPTPAMVASGIWAQHLLASMPPRGWLRARPSLKSRWQVRAAASLHSFLSTWRLCHSEKCVRLVLSGASTGDTHCSHATVFSGAATSFSESTGQYCLAVLPETVTGWQHTSSPSPWGSWRLPGVPCKYHHFLSVL